MVPPFVAAAVEFAVWVFVYFIYFSALRRGAFVRLLLQSHSHREWLHISFDGLEPEPF